MFNRLFRNSTLSLFLLFFMTSCSSLQSIEPPEVSVRDLRVGTVTFFETTALVSLRIDNVNDIDIKSTGGIYKLYVNGDYLGKAFDNEGFTVSSFSSETKQLNLLIDNVGVFKQIQSLMQRPKVDYRLDAKIKLSKPSRRTVSLEQYGTIDFIESLQPSGRKQAQ